MNEMDKMLKALSDPELCLPLLDRIRAELDAPLRFMEVCGTHTVSIFRSGLRSLLPEGITHLSGPGCPVCVTHDLEIGDCINLAGMDGVILATFGDLMRVPGPDGRTLKDAKAAGARVEVVYSPFNALELARENPDDSVVFPGIGFETTAPVVAATVQMAERSGVENFYVLSCHKLVPPVLRFLLEEAGRTGQGSGGIDAFLLPGHVSTILGLEPYRFVAEEFACPGVVGGFEPADILHALLLMLRLRKSGVAEISNGYKVAVADQGNPKARRIMDEVFQVETGLWRGMNLIENSALAFRQRYSCFDARLRFAMNDPVARFRHEGVGESGRRKDCRCGDVLMGKSIPPDCRLFGKACTPASPVGPCMVSTEGSCSAYYKYSM